MSKRLLILMCSIFLVVPLLFMGCGSDGSDGKDGINGTNGTNGTNGKDLTAVARPESCAVCHGTAGDQHQATYDVLYQDNIIRVENVVYSFNAADNTDVVTFNMISKDPDADSDCTKVQNLNIYFTQYNQDNNTFGFDPVVNSRSLKGTLASVSGGCTSTKASPDNVSLLTKNGLVIVYGFDESSGRLFNRVQQAQFPYAGFVKTGVVDYVSAANVSGCEKCHIVPFLKHGNIYGQINHVAATDFYTCKACHLDNRPGEDIIWQILVNDPVAAAAIEVGGATETPAQEAQYAYKTRLMNDTHMSHAMEFAYPQSMRNCNTCHAGKLNVILADKEFVAETCKSCHPVTTPTNAESEKPQPSMQELWKRVGVDGFHSMTMTCNISNCHAAGGGAKTFGELHTGYDPEIYTSTGTRYSSVFTVTIDNASFNDNTKILTFGFSATESPDLPGLAVTDIKPTVLVGLYGWDSKDYIVGPHLNHPDGRRNLEYKVVEETHPRFTTVLAADGKWVVTADLSTWTDNIANGSVKRAEIAVMPTLRSAALPAGDNVIALNAPSRTFVLATKVLQSPALDTAGIVKVTAGCNNCHDALGTSFHSGDRGGNIVVCRLCHTTVSGASHLEMQSRSIDSYAHALHSFQKMDIQNVHFDNDVQQMYYNLHIESNFPTFGLNNCEACHNKGKYNAPDQSKSLSGLHSASRDNVIGWNRKIDSVPSYVTGPGSRACGGCHRAEFIKEDDAVGLASFNSHTRTNGYLLEGANVFTEINRIMYNWEDGIVLPSP